MISKVVRFTLPLALVVLGSTLALAHPGHAGHDTIHSVQRNALLDGLTHPLFGGDHVLAMVTVGLLSAQIGGRATWALPGSFLVSMILGGAAGMSAFRVPAVEYGIAASIILLGIAVACNQKLPMALPIAFTALFGFIHGQVHGIEMQLMANPLRYATGFVATTLVLHIAGVAVGLLAIKSVRGASGLRLSGAAIATAGCYFAFMI